jgi:hypothetical protein
MTSDNPDKQYLAETLRVSKRKIQDRLSTEAIIQSAEEQDTPIGLLAARIDKLELVAVQAAKNHDLALTTAANNQLFVMSKIAENHELAMVTTAKNHELAMAKMATPPLLKMHRRAGYRLHFHNLNKVSRFWDTFL